MGGIGYIDSYYDLNFKDAIAFCRKNGGELPFLRNRLQVARSKFSKKYNYRYTYWLGVEHQEGLKWKWFNGQNVINKNLGWINKIPRDSDVDRCAVNNGETHKIEQRDCEIKATALCQIKCF